METNYYYDICHVLRIRYFNWMVYYTNYVRSRSTQKRTIFAYVE